MPRLSHSRLDPFLDEQLAVLRSQRFIDLAGLPTRRRLPAPADLKGFEFWRSRQSTPEGTVQVRICGCIRRLLVFLSCSCREFEMLPDGSILPEEPLAIED